MNELKFKINNTQGSKYISYEKFLSRIGNNIAEILPRNKFAKNFIEIKMNVSITPRVEKDILKMIKTHGKLTRDSLLLLSAIDSTDFDIIINNLIEKGIITQHNEENSIVYRIAS